MSNSDKVNIEQAYTKKLEEYSKLSEEELTKLKESDSLKGTYKRALNYVIENKLYEKGLEDEAVDTISNS